MTCVALLYADRMQKVLPRTLPASCGKDSQNLKVFLVKCLPAPKEGFMSPFRLSCCLAALTLALVACQPSPAPVTDTTPTASEPAAASPATGQTDLAGLIARAGIRCDSSPASVNSADCHAGNGYAIDLHPDCGDDGFFAASLGPHAVPLAAQPGAEASGSLPGNQFVCIQASARQAQDPDYYYVQAMDPAQVAACHGDATCQEYLPAADAACTAARPQGCSQGWVTADALEVFSNGIGAQAL